MNSLLIASRRVAILGAAVAIGFSGAPAAQAKTGKAGWQGAATLSVSTGVQHGFVTYNCPTNFVARSGAFFPNPTLQNLGINLGVNGPRIDIGNYYTWGFEYNIPGGAPSGTTILLDVYCTKLPV